MGCSAPARHPCPPATPHALREEYARARAAETLTLERMLSDLGNHERFKL
jgi:hypothetical protein